MGSDCGRISPPRLSQYWHAPALLHISIAMEFCHTGTGSPDVSPKPASQFDGDESYLPSSSDEESRSRAIKTAGRGSARKNAGTAFT